MKKKYYLIAIFILVIAIFAYHLYAASEAERQIDKTIQEQTAKAGFISVQYSSVDVAPFSGKVSFINLTVIFKDHIQRAQELTFDISYLDFLNVYFGDVTYGLEKLNQAKVTLFQPSYLNKSSLREVKMDTLQMSYRGEALDGLLAMINKSAFSSDHSIKAKASKLTLRFPKTFFSKIIAENFHYAGSVPEGKSNYWINGEHRFAVDSLIWSPSEPFQNTYQFFIRGFGYSPDAIPFQSAQLYSEPVSGTDTLHVKTALDSELAQLSAMGFIDLNKPFGTSELQDVEVSVTEFSASFEQVLQNIEQLLSTSLPRESNGITLEVTGTLANPRIPTTSKSK